MTTPKLTEEQLDTVASRLEGQCVMDIEAVLEEEGLIELYEEIEVMRQIDERVFLCECCGWWASTDELNNEGARNLCDQCHEEEEGDEDDDDED